VEDLGREERQPRELQLLAFGERIAQLQHAAIRDADDVAGIGVLQDLARCERNDTALAVFTSLPVRELFSFMPRSNRPEATRNERHPVAVRRDPCSPGS
jgi:hypothetical protein